MLDSYINILVESLQKKVKYLEELKNMSFSQSEYLQGEDPDFERFTEIVNEKDMIIDELDKLDEGFDATYAQIKDELIANKDQYKTQISTLQELIRKVTDLGVEIQAQEARNKTAVEQVVSSTRRKYKSAIQSIDVARKYSSTMHNPSSGTQFMAKKK